MNPYVKLIRPLNCTMGGLGVFIAVLIGIGLNVLQFWFEVIIAVITVFIFMAGANALNDYFDRNVDKINHPERPIPSRKISAGSALNFSIAALIASVVLSFLLSMTSVLIVISAAMLIVLYEIRYKHKGLIGNMIISLLVGLIFIFGGSVVSEYQLNIILAVMAVFANLGREIVKDIEDMEGDRDRFTLPKKIGIGPAGYTASIMIILAVVISPLPYFLELIPWVNLGAGVGFHYLIIVLFADVVFMNSIIYTKNNPKRSSALLKLGMLIALVAFLSTAIY